MAVNFTPAQQQAINAQNRELLVSAAAGSGKTAVLVERIVRMIEHGGLSIDRMLIVTFTRAAAGEMRERLESRLTQAAEGDPRLMRQADLVAAAQISTIHSFCQQTVRRHFQHCGIDPQFGLCDERTRAAFYQESMQEVLDRIYELAREDDELNALIRKFTEKQIADMMDTLYRFLMSRPDPLEWLEKHASQTWNLATLNDQPVAKAFCAEAGLIVDGMLSLLHESEEAAREPAFPEKYIKNLRDDALVLHGLSEACQKGLTHLMETLAALKFSKLAVFRPSTGDEARLAEEFKETRNRYKKMVEELTKLLPQDCTQAVTDMAVMRPATGGLAKAVKLFHETFSGKKREMAVIDFNDLEHMTLSILKEPELQKELRHQFDAIFVDEYQDVSELQEAILNGLKREAGDGPKQYAFYVGDVKQSIYRFRLAEPGLFLSKLNRFSADENAEYRKIILNRNFRSKSAVLDAVNRIFAHVMDSRVTEIDYDDDAKLFPGNPSKGDPQTEVHVLNSYERRPQDQVMAEAEWIARDILRTVGTPVVDGEGNECGTLRYRDIAILLPVSKNIADKVELVLSREGIPVYSDTSADAMGSDEVMQMIQYLSLLDNLMNDVALLSVLRSPLFEMTEPELSAIRLLKPEREASFLNAMLHASMEADEPLKGRCAAVLQKLADERFYLNSMPLSDYLWDFLIRSGLYAHYGAQPGGKLRQANLRMLCSRAGEYEQNHMDGLHGFVESLTIEGAGSPESSPTVINPWEDVVRIMTIHKSKGLEFPTVYVMNLGRNLFGRGSGKIISVHGEVGFGLEYVNENARTKRTTLLQGAISLREKNAERAERARVLYVALTRPKSRLVMVGSQSEKSLWYDDLVDRVQNRGAADVYAVRSANTMLEWILQSASSCDQIEEWGEGEFSTDELRKTQLPMVFSTEPTCFPHKNMPWRIVFHTDLDVKRKNSTENDMPKIHIPDVENDVVDNSFFAEGDPIAPKLTFTHRPLKVGVTALVRAMLQGTQVEDEEENAETKRMPMLTARPRTLDSLPAMPAFMEPPKEERSLQIGLATHKMLGLIDLERIRAVAHNPKALYAVICREAERLTESGVMTAQEAEYADRGMVARFLESDLGARMLRSPRVMREWPFNLHVTEPFDTIVQGVIDLCFLEDGQWVLVDFKTDRTSSARELWPRYCRQLEFYRMALQKATPFPVAVTALYALRAGESFDGMEQEK
ncbi:MAG: helicase-exonuclease AddAB subunit AddA [Clostridia bacterium]|nr:helicase-exonuclease AddAB subunit AddA [Clostridia bacterium]